MFLQVLVRMSLMCRKAFQKWQMNVKGIWLCRMSIMGPTQCTLSRSFSLLPVMHSGFRSVISINGMPEGWLAMALHGQVLHMISTRSVSQTSNVCHILHRGCAFLLKYCQFCISSWFRFGPFCTLQKPRWSELVQLVVSTGYDYSYLSYGLFCCYCCSCLGRFYYCWV